MFSGEGVLVSFQQMLAMVLFVFQAMCLATEKRLSFTGTIPKCGTQAVSVGIREEMVRTI